jgi:uncharacterized membrane protein (DUF106 family)
MKRLKKEMKDKQQEMKKYKDDPQKMMAMQKKAMEKNMEYMKHSMKSTLFTMLPIIIIFGYLNAHLGYLPITPDTPFTTTVFFDNGADGEIMLDVDNIEILNSPTQEIVNSMATFELQGEEGEYILQYRYNNEGYSQELLITEDRTYRPVDKKINRNGIKKLRINNEKVKPFDFTGIPWVKNWGWIGAYIVFSLIFSIVIRKLMKVA